MFQNFIDYSNTRNKIEFEEFKNYGEDRFYKKRFLVNKTKWFDTLEEVINYIQSKIKTNENSK